VPRKFKNETVPGLQGRTERTERMHGGAREQRRKRHGGHKTTPPTVVPGRRTSRDEWRRRAKPKKFTEQMSRGGKEPTPRFEAGGRRKGAETGAWVRGDAEMKSTKTTATRLEEKTRIESGRRFGGALQPIKQEKKEGIEHYSPPRKRASGGRQKGEGD